jgi:hypothetical protein
VATGYTQAELDALLLVLEDAVPKVPSKKDKKDAEHVIAMRFAGTEKGVLSNFETKGGKQEIYWLNCWVAKELAAALSSASQAYGRPKRVPPPRPGEHLVQPKRAHLATAIGANSLSTSADPDGVLVRFAVGHRIRQPSPSPKTRLLSLPDAAGRSGNRCCMVRCLSILLSDLRTTPTMSGELSPAGSESGTSAGESICPAFRDLAGDALGFKFQPTVAYFVRPSG